MADWDIPIDEESHGETVLAALNDALVLLRESWYGTTDPATKSPSESTPGMQWVDSTLAGSTGSVLQIRNDGNSKWINTINISPDTPTTAGVGYILSQDGQDRWTGGALTGTAHLFIGGTTVASSRLSITNGVTDLKSQLLKDPLNDSTASAGAFSKRVHVNIGGVVYYLRAYVS